MKQVWSSPKTSFEQFVPQVYCKNCSADDNTKYVYSFECNAGVSGGRYAVYLENGKADGLQTSGPNKDTERLDGSHYYYHPCGATHTVEVMGKLTEANLNSIFPEGYIRRNGVTTPVRVWTEGGTDTHCTTALDIDDFQLAKS